MTLNYFPLLNQQQEVAATTLANPKMSTFRDKDVLEGTLGFYSFWWALSF
jgi:hypothetical protein